MDATTQTRSDQRGIRPAGEGEIEREVLRRYAAAAQRAAPGLCCPSESQPANLLAKLPREIIEKDYGCGDPTAYVGAGERVVDLGCGAGKACYLLAQKVGPAGEVIGVDFNDAMLALARRYQGQMARRLGYANMRFVKARVQDLGLDLERAGRWLRERPVTTVEGWSAFEAECGRLRREEPALVPGGADVVVSNCVLNLVRPADKPRLFEEIHRVLRRGGRAVISDIVCDEEPTAAIVSDPELWSGCIAGAFREDRFLEFFERAGFYGVQILARQERPWQVIDGIEFRSLTVRAFKGEQGPCLERNQALIYRGPWKTVRDDDGHTLRRGRRMAVCDKTFRILTDPAGPYAPQVVPVPPRRPVPLEQAAPFDCRRGATRHPRQTKGLDYDQTRRGAESCGSGDSCC